MRRLESERETVSVVDDQHGQPTWTADLAEQIVAMVEADAPAGTYHGTASGSTTWRGLAQLVFELAGADPARVGATTTAAFPRPAPRPAWSVLGHDRWKAAGGSEEDLMSLGGWRSPTAMRRYGSSLAAARAREAHHRLSPGDRL